MQRLASYAASSCVKLSLLSEENTDELSALVVANLDHLSGHMPWIKMEPLSAEKRRKLIRGWRSDYDRRKGATYAVRQTQGDSQIVGVCSLRVGTLATEAEVGYWLAEKWQGRSLGTRAAALATEIAFNLDTINSVEIHHDIANLRSSLIPQRLGYAKISISEDPEGSVLGDKDAGQTVVWGMDRHTWRSKGLSDRF